MKREDINTSLLMYNPWDEKTISKLETYDEFNESFGKVNKGKVIVYIILVYDINSQLRREIPYFNQRKIVAGELAEFPKNSSGKFLEIYEDVMIGLNKKVNNAISKYIILFADPKYINLVYYWSILTSEYENITGYKESRDYKNTIANIEKLEIKIKECTDYLFGGNEIKDIRRALYEQVERENLRLRPEDIAMADNVDELIESPYGDYKPDKLKYLGNK